jgi:FKBP-type peptidyl-prolyl cis-trans isomerase
MKSIVILLVVIGAIGGGFWWYADQRNTQIAVEREAAEIAAAAQLREDRLALYGEEGLAEDIQWSDSGLGIKPLVEGTGPKPLAGGFVTFDYRVRLKDGTEVQKTEKPTEARIGQMIPGVSAGLMQLKRGGSALLFIPPKLGYGKRGYGPIPADAGLLFEVELLDR